MNDAIAVQPSPPAALNEEGASRPAWEFFGNAHAVASLRQALRSGRLAHAYLFTGPPGVGKATLARRLAAALACEAEDAEARPCLECRACRQVEAGAAPDIERIALGGVCDEGGPQHRDHAADGSTRIRICQVRRIERVANLAPFQSPRRIFVVDTADDLQREAAHALLKLLEEPPEQVLLVLLAADADALLPTVRSRCQEIALRPMTHGALADALVTGRSLDPATADELARQAHGRYGLAVQLHTDPSLRMLRETAVVEALRLAEAGRNARFDYAATLAGRWQRERQSVLDTLDAWREWWRGHLLASALTPGPSLTDGRGGPDDLAFAQSSAPSPHPGERGVGGEGRAVTPRQALQALVAVQRARQHLLENVNPQLALEVMMLDLPVIAGSGDTTREEAPVAATARA